MMRKPVFAGKFYPKTKQELETALEQTGLEKTFGKARAIIVPHAGIQYSGKTAAKAYNQIQEALMIILLGTNHSHQFRGILSSQQDWKTPFGTAKTWKNKTFNASEEAHASEHSIEVQLPFLQYKLKEFEFLPLSVSQNPYRELEENAKKIIQLKPDLVIASADMSHSGPWFGDTTDYDPKAIQLIQEMKPEQFYEYSKDSTICGGQTITLLLIIAKTLGLKPELQEHSKSPGENRVGYASFTFQ